MPCYSPLKGYKDEQTGGLTFIRKDSREKMEVACGQCLGCRLDRSRMWATRICHEASLSEHTRGNCFVTLTYRDEIQATEEQKKKLQYIPFDWSLNKDHFTKFMKRLRKSREPDRIRFYQCGEYGRRCKHGFDLGRQSCPVCRLGRPHHHACLFNVSFDDLVSYRSDNGVLRYTSAELEELWGYGFVDVGELNFETAAYVARYILKKITGARSEDHYLSVLDDGTQFFLTPEYVTMSRRPGIGKKWFEMFKGDVFPSDVIPVPGKGVFRKVPRYYDELFADSNPVSMEQIKKLRRKFKEEHPEEYTLEKLEAKYKIKKAQVEMLKRTIG